MSIADTRSLCQEVEVTEVEVLGWEEFGWIGVVGEDLRWESRVINAMKRTEQF